MTISILILVHLIYLGKVIDAWGNENARVVLTSSLLILLCWNINEIWGIATLVTTVIIFLGLTKNKQ